MIKKTVTTKSLFTGEDVTEELYFHLTKADIVELDMAYQSVGGFNEQIKLMNNGANAPVIIATFKDVIGRAYGLKIGEKFIKDDAATKAFLTSDAYSEIFIGLLQGNDDPAEFIKGIMPSDLEMNEGKTPSQIARERSEAQFQGHKQKQTPELKTAEPDLEAVEYTRIQAEDQKATDEAKEPSYEEFLAWQRSQGK